MANFRRRRTNRQKGNYLDTRDNSRAAQNPGLRKQAEQRVKLNKLSWELGSKCEESNIVIRSNIRDNLKRGQ